MKLVEQLIAEAGGDPLSAVTIVPGVCAHVKSVKDVALISPQRIVLSRRKQQISVEGEDLKLDGYCDGDALISGGVKRVEVC